MGGSHSSLVAFSLPWNPMSWLHVTARPVTCTRNLPGLLFSVMLVVSPLRHWDRWLLHLRHSGQISFPETLGQITFPLGQITFPFEILGRLLSLRHWADYFPWDIGQITFPSEALRQITFQLGQITFPIRHWGRLFSIRDTGANYFPVWSTGADYFPWDIQADHFALGQLVLIVWLPSQSPLSSFKYLWNSCRILPG